MTARREIPFGRPWITDEDRQAVLEVLGGHILTHGPQCRAFEEEFVAFMGGGYAVSTSSCMAALHLAYFYLGLGPGDEVIVPAQTHTATVHAVELVGARPVFVDCELTTGNIDPALIEGRITPRTRALSLVHFDGIPADMDAIMAIAERHDLRVVEDSALALGARYKGTHVGLIGDIGTFSFYPVKHITTGEGGMYVSRHADVAARSARLRAFGVDRRHDERAIPGHYDVTDLGLNYRMSEMQAALGRGQLRKIDAILARRKANFMALQRRLLDGVGEHVIILDSADPDRASSYYCMTVILQGALAPQRDDLVLRLNAAGVGTSIYYPQPVPAMTYYRNKYGYARGDYPNAERISYQSIALPVGPHLDEDDMAYIAEQFILVIKDSLL